MSRPLVVDVGRLLRDPGIRLHEQRATPLVALGVLGSVVPADSDVAVDVVIEAMDDRSLVATGEVRAPWTAECSRCLRPIVGSVTAPVRELFESPSASGGEEREATPDDQEIYPLLGDQVDLEPLARDAVLLALPQAPLCAEDCAGLCPVCGADRNEGDCGCDTTVRDERWAALDALKDS
ncbi:MAG: DUF177 domain-containing protein [Actinobacteria bacterium]|nr:DUF177 domain-containing protein [Actinomycetota bacterium]